MVTPQNNNYGIVYLLTNTAMPGIVKIGMTTRDSVESRMKELFSTSVPVPFECAYACKVDAKDCNRIERALHIAFQPDRVHPQREFFKINPEQAEAILRLLDKTNDITKEIVAEINSDLSPIDKAADERLKRSRRPPLNYIEMGIPIGAKLHFGSPDSDMVAEVCSKKKLLYRGEETSMSALTRIFLDLDYNINPSPHWYYGDRLLNDIYNETYPYEEN